MTPHEATPALQPWHRRLHVALMPDYNRAASVYWWLATVLGHVFLLYCLVQVVALPGVAVLQVAIAMMLAVAAGLFPVRITGIKVSFAAGELFIFLVLLLHGAAAAAAVAAAEAAVGSYRTSRRWTSRLGSPAMATLAMGASGSLFDLGRGIFAPSGGEHAVVLLALAMAASLLYFLCSATLMSGVARLRRGDPLLQLDDVVSTFHWVGIAYAASAMFAVLVYLVYRQVGGSVLLVMSPLVTLLLLALHFYYRNQEVQARLTMVQAAAAAEEIATVEREREAAARQVRELQLSERRFRGVFDNASIGMVLMEFGGAILDANETMADLLGRPGGSLLAQPFSGFVHADDRPAFTANLLHALAVNFDAFSQVLRLVGTTGGERWVIVHCSYFKGPAVHGQDVGGRPCLVLQAQDVQAIHRAEFGLLALPCADTLSGLASRQRFIECAHALLLRRQKVGESGFAVVVVGVGVGVGDLGHVNDRHGPGASDALLMNWAGRLQTCCRPGDVLARVGADAFAWLVDRVEVPVDASALAERVKRCFQPPLQIDGQEVTASVRVGIALARPLCHSGEALLDEAFAAMKRVPSERTL